ncbi:FtsX-like permease family protein [Candidatus Poribacteria bacterium]|nr:FtsX-like permease family protein [Candidatus Poribacteria bacterium]
MNLLEGIASGIQALSSHKMRTLLTLLGVMIGVAAVIGMISIGDGAKTIIMEDSEKLGGATMIRFRRSRHIRQGNRWVRNNSEEQFTYEDALAIEKQCPSVQHVIPSIPVRRGARISAGAGLDMRETYSSYEGVTPAFQEAMKWKTRVGRFISDADVEHATSICVLGQDIVNELFGDEEAMFARLTNDFVLWDAEVRIRNERFTVVGIMASRGRSLRYGFNLDDGVFIPITTVQQRFTGNDYISSLSVQVKSIQHVPKAMEEVSELLKKRHRGEEFFETRDVASGLDFVLKINKIIKILLTGVAGFSLLIGGIGIMNIMLVAVAERTREIGLRKAIGAKPRDILGQFLIEAVMLCALGGLLGLLLGVIFGVGVAWIITSFIIKTINWPSALPLFWAIISLVFSAVIGVFFGLYPAIRASRLTPVEALRSE